MRHPSIVQTYNDGMSSYTGIRTNAKLLELLSESLGHKISSFTVTIDFLKNVSLQNKLLIYYKNVYTFFPNNVAN